MDLWTNLARVEGIVEEVGGKVADGNLDGAALELGTHAGKIERFTGSYTGLQLALRDEGASDERALERM